MRFITIFAVLLFALFNTDSTATAQSGETPDLSSTPTPTTAVLSAASDGPESSLRIFMKALISGDRERLEQVTHPNDDVERLLPKQRLSVLATNRTHTSWDKKHIKRLKVGEKLEYSNGRSKVLDDSMVNENYAVLNVPDSNATFRAVLVDEKWKIDPKTIRNVSFHYDGWLGR